MIKVLEKSSRLLRLIGRPDDAQADQDRRWAHLLKRMAHGDADALSTLYDETSPVVFGLLLQILHERHTAEEVLLEVYAHAWREAATFTKHEQAAVIWLITLARDFAVDRRRRAGRQYLFEQERRAANMALARLSNEQRSILEMTYLRGLSTDQVAHLLELSPEHVRAQIIEGMERLSLQSRQFCYSFCSALTGSLSRTSRAGK